MLIVATESNALMKIPISNEMNSNTNTYLLQDAINTVDNIELKTGDSSLQVVLLTSIVVNRTFWILFSNGKLYEYNFCTKKLTVIDDSGRIDYFITL